MNYDKYDDAKASYVRMIQDFMDDANGVAKKIEKKDPKGYKKVMAAVLQAGVAYKTLKGELR